MLCLGIVAGACQTLEPDAAGAHTGVSTVSLLDGPAGAPLRCEVWYPAVASAVQTRQVYGPGYLGRAARDAPLRSGEHYPLVVASHGLRGTRYDLSWLGEALAAAGFILASVDHPGSDAASFVDATAYKLWLRAQTLSHVVDGLQGDGRFGAAIDAHRIAAVGHSLGGSTVLVWAGARLDPERFANAYPGSAPAPSQAVFDPRVRAVMALAPGTAVVFDDDGVRAVRTPVLLVSGSADENTPEATQAAFYAANLRQREWHSLPGAAHYVFRPTCTLYNRVTAAYWCRDKWGIDRDAVHADIARMARTFLNKHLQ